jgi:hypothetical protein
VPTGSHSRRRSSRSTRPHAPPTTCSCAYSMCSCDLPLLRRENPQRNPSAESIGPRTCCPSCMNFLRASLMRGLPWPERRQDRPGQRPAPAPRWLRDAERDRLHEPLASGPHGDGGDLARLPTRRSLRPQPFHAGQEPGPDSRDDRRAHRSPGARRG